MLGEPIKLGLLALLLALIAFAGCATNDTGSQPDAAPVPPPRPDAACASTCSGTCVDLETDRANCGKCGMACSDPGGGGTSTCDSGKCKIVCPSPKVECYGACVDTSTDHDNCGGCGFGCFGTAQCTQGLCCQTGETICNMACATLSDDPNNCGACGKVCPPNTPVCSNGACKDGCVDPNEVRFQGKCYYLDGSRGICDQGYALASNADLAAILQSDPNAWAGKSYKHVTSTNCCILTSDFSEDYGMVAHCNVPGPFSNGEPVAGGSKCSGVYWKYLGQLTLCAK
jgi:hypothetical protein